MSDRMDKDADRYGGRESGQSSRSAEFQQAVDRLEVAVQTLVSSARDQVADRATAFLDETTRRLERESGPRRSDADSGGSATERMRARRRARSRRHAERLTRRSRRLYRDPEQQKIAGVCAGIANYYGVEIWVVRCVAVTGLLFLPSIVFPGSWLLYFLMRKPPSADDNHARTRQDDTSPTPEFGPQHSPRRSLRNAQIDLAQVELRLRRMESHVTSGRFELQRELNKIDESTNVGGR